MAVPFSEFPLVDQFSTIQIGPDGVKFNPPRMKACATPKVVFDSAKLMEVHQLMVVRDIVNKVSKDSSLEISFEATKMDEEVSAAAQAVASTAVVEVVEGGNLDENKGGGKYFKPADVNESHDVNEGSHDLTSTQDKKYMVDSFSQQRVCRLKAIADSKIGNGPSSDKFDFHGKEFKNQIVLAIGDVAGIIENALSDPENEDNALMTEIQSKFRGLIADAKMNGKLYHRESGEAGEADQANTCKILTYLLQVKRECKIHKGEVFLRHAQPDGEINTASDDTSTPVSSEKKENDGNPASLETSQKDPLIDKSSKVTETGLSEPVQGGVSEPVEGSSKKEASFENDVVQDDVTEFVERVEVGVVIVRENVDRKSARLDERKSKRLSDAAVSVGEKNEDEVTKPGAGADATIVSEAGAVATTGSGAGAAATTESGAEGEVSSGAAPPNADEHLDEWFEDNLQQLKELQSQNSASAIWLGPLGENIEHLIPFPDITSISGYGILLQALLEDHPEWDVVLRPVLAYNYVQNSEYGSFEDNRADVGIFEMARRTNVEIADDTVKRLSELPGTVVHFTRGEDNKSFCQLEKIEENASVLFPKTLDGHWHGKEDRACCGGNCYIL